MVLNSSWTYIGNISVTCQANGSILLCTYCPLSDLLQQTQLILSPMGSLYLISSSLVKERIVTERATPMSLPWRCWDCRGPWWMRGQETRPITIFLFRGTCPFRSRMNDWVYLLSYTLWGASSFWEFVASVWKQKRKYIRHQVQSPCLRKEIKCIHALILWTFVRWLLLARDWILRRFTQIS